MPKRDTQRQRCYDAENAIKESIKPQGYSTVREVATFFRNVMESDWFQRRFPYFNRLKIFYQPRTRGAWAWVTQHDTSAMTNAVSGKISLSNWAIGRAGKNGGELILLHELAHCIIPGVHHHDRRWARTFLEMVYHYLGDDAGKALEASMKLKGAKFRPYRTVTDAQRAAASLRLAQIRTLRVAAKKQPVDSVPVSG